MKSCLLCGVGGQGTVLASRLIAAAAMEKGLFARTAETIGMAQRGGCVVSHVRVGEDVPSPLIPPASADVIVGFEPAEAARCMGFLKPGGTVIVCDRPVQPVTASLSGAAYDTAAMLEYIRAGAGAAYVLSSERITAQLGSLKALNVTLLGALGETGAMGLGTGELEKALEARVKPAYIEMNRKALALGAAMARGDRA